MKNTEYRVRLSSFAALLYRSFRLRRTRQGSGHKLSFLKQPVDAVLRSSFTLYHFLFLFFTALFFSSCEKVIDINLKEADKKVVIEGNVAFGQAYNGVRQEVRISETRNFYEDNISSADSGFNGLSGAIVTVQVNSDSVYTYYETQNPGIYGSFFKGVPGSTYLLTVKLNGNTYTATSTMPAQIVPLDSLWAEALVFGGSTNITIYPKYDDPKGLGNNYRLVEYANDTLVRKAFPQNDEFSDGNTVTRPLINPDSKLKERDNITVELQCIDADVYKYWYSLDAAATGNNQSATPSNPVANIAGGALGYFSAYSATRYSFQIP